MGIRTGCVGLPAALGVALSAIGAAGCQYDYDKLYADGSGSSTVPENLVDLWRAESFASDACRACARAKCGDDNTACQDDPECLALTTCVAASADPANLNYCRAQHADWLRDDIVDRDLGGPYYQCVFRDQCDAECGAHEAFACLDDFSWPASSDRSFPFTLRLSDALTGRPSVGVTVRACQAEAPGACQQLGEAQVSDAQGVVTLDLEATGNQFRSFQGYLELDGGGLYPTLLRLGWPVTREGVANVTVIDQNSVELSIAIAPGGRRLEEDSGLLQLRAFGCMGVGVGGVSFDVDDNAEDELSEAWYTEGTETLPSFTAIQTSQLGVGGIINVKEGRRIVTATRAETSKPMSSLSVPVRRGFMTIVLMMPNGT
jgi:hypothetical protein